MMYVVLNTINGVVYLVDYEQAYKESNVYGLPESFKLYEIKHSLLMHFFLCH
jgi:hypothetical protein